MEVLYPRCAGVDVHSRRVNACVRVGGRSHGHDRASGVRDHDGGSARHGGLADRSRLHARGDGGDRRVLEAGVAHPRRRGVVHVGARQRAAHPERSGPQERPERRGLDRRPVGARADYQPALTDLQVLAEPYRAPHRGSTHNLKGTVWSVAGYGAGGLMLTPRRRRSDRDRPFELAFKADALWVGTRTDAASGASRNLKATSRRQPPRPQARLLN